ncbi:MAG: cyclic nucleotide-binding domain-containing protein [Spirochaetia bacterium]|nr:cyclic nucleotide-binding domain-containing protein [Spirochaetia bacterium]
MNLHWFRDHGISVVEFLGNSEILAGLNRHTLKALARAFVPVTIPRGTALMQQGEKGDALFLVGFGRLQAVRTHKDGTSTVLGEICTGEIVGEAAVLTDEPRFASVIALEESQLLRLSRADFQALIPEHPEEIRQMSLLISRRQERGLQQNLRPVSSQLIDFLKSVPLFGVLPSHLLEEIEPHLTWLHLPAGRDLMRQGDDADGLYVIVSGRARFEIRDAAGAIIREGSFARGEIIGELALLTGDTRSATVRAMRDAELVKLSDVSVQRLLHEAPEAVFWLARIIAERLSRDTQPHRKPFSVLTVLPISPGLDIAPFCSNLAEALRESGTVEIVRQNQIDEKFGSGSSELDVDNPHLAEWLVWLSAKEHNVDYLLLEGNATSLRWNERCLRQADRALLVADATSDPRLSALEIKHPSDAEQIFAERTLVLLQPDNTVRASNTAAFLAARPDLRHFHVRINSRTDSSRLARILTGRAIGLVLGGGGARGMAHIGVLEALLEEGLPVDMIGGTSAGAIMGGAFAYFPDLATVKQVVRRLMVDQNPLNDYTFPFLSIARGKKYSGALQDAFSNALLEDLLLPTFAIACNLTNSTEAVIQRGFVWTALRATSSLPGIAPPLYWNGQLFVDGGIVNNVPVDVMRQFGAGKILAIDVSSSDDNADAEYGRFMNTEIAPVGPSFLRVLANKLRPRSSRRVLPSLAGVLLRATLVGSTERLSHAKQEADVFARLPIDSYGLLDWKAMDELIEIGYRYAKENMPVWKEKLGIKPRS